VLDRVKNFLPLIEKANKELEDTIRQQGASSVQIDAGLLQPDSSARDVSSDSEDSEEHGAGDEVMVSVNNFIRCEGL
jgi:hypothetical protein